MQGAERSNHHFMNVKDIINMAFGELDGNIVNFRLIRIILYLLARQLRILERRVEVSVPIGLIESAGSFSVTEVKVHAVTKKGSKDSRSTKYITDDADDRSSSKTRRESKGLKDDTKTRERGRVRERKGSRGEVKGSKSRSGSKEDNESYLSRSSSNESEEDEITILKKKMDRLQRKGVDKESVSGKDSKIDKPSKQDRRTRIGQKESDKRGEGKEIKEHKDRKEYEGSEEGKESKGSNASQAYSKRKKRSESDERSETADVKLLKSKRGEKDSRSRNKQKQGDQQIASESLSMTEKELRVIHQRTDSHEEPDETPTPMASVDDMETRHERLLVVQSGSSEDRRESGTPKMSVVTQEEFTQLANVVNDLCIRFKIDDSEADLMAGLHKRASYTEAMAALQLSARLEATEKLLGRMIAAIGTIAHSTPGIELDDETKLVLKSHGVTSEIEEKGEKKTGQQKTSKKGKRAKQETETLDDIRRKAALPDAPAKTEPNTETEGLKQDCVTYMDLE